MEAVLDFTECSERRLLMYRLGWCKVVILILSLLGGSQHSYAQMVKVSYAGSSGYNVPLWVTYDAGLFKKYSLDIAEFTLISSGAPNIQALLANELQFANVAGTAPIQAALQGANVVIIATSYNLIPYSLLVRSDIKSVADLKGEKVAISRMGGIDELAARLAFDHLGLGSRDMAFIQAGADAQRIAALLSGSVAATLVAPPGLFRATSQGVKVLSDLGGLDIKYPVSCIVSAKSYVGQNRDAVKKFLMAFIEGLHLYTRDKEFSIKVTEKYTKLKDRDILSRSYDYFAKNTTLLPLTDSTSIENAVKTAAVAEKVSNRRAEEFYDNSIIQELVAGGFVEKITKKVGPAR
jgi:ABC-type nitrate/sulfonate/bicarbonate transport system substrate-binding protein